MPFFEIELYNPVLHVSRGDMRSFRAAKTSVIGPRVFSVIFIGSWWISYLAAILAQSSKFDRFDWLGETSSI